MKHAIPIIAFHLSLFTLHLSLRAAVPVRWTVETSRVQPAVFEAYQGETLDLAASLQSYGRPVETPGSASLFWQTNGMGARWWTAPASVSSNVLSAVWSPTNDVGARVYTCFIGQTGSNYRAEFQLRLRPSPGATPNLLPLPHLTEVDIGGMIDDALAERPVGVSADQVRGMIDSEVGGTNSLTHGGPYVYAERGYDADDGSVQQIAYLGPGRGPSLGGSRHDYYLAYRPPTTTQHRSLGILDMASGLSPSPVPTFYSFDPFASEGHVETLMEYFEDLDATALKRGETSASDIGAAPASVADTVQAWQTYWDGDDVRVTVTNYYGSEDLPHLYIEQKMPADETHDEAWFKVIWDETTRHQPILQRISALESEVADKADRAWGFYDSHTGEYSPDGYTQISSSNILIAAGMAYQKTITTGGEVWVLTATEPTTISGVASNGFFRISDGDGNALFEIVKGDKRTVGATAGSIHVSGNVIHITYDVVSDAPPTIWCTTDLRNGSWREIPMIPARDPVGYLWDGESGHWVAELTSGDEPLPPKLFLRATYRLGAETYIKNSAPVGFERVYIGGRSYRVTVEMVSGKKLMVLNDD